MYASPIVVSIATTVKAKAFKTGRPSSSTAIGTFTLALDGLNLKVMGRNYYGQLGDGTHPLHSRSPDAGPAEHIAQSRVGFFAPEY